MPNLIVCSRCHSKNFHYAKKMCRSCYNKNLQGNKIQNKGLAFLESIKDTKIKECIIPPFALTNNGRWQITYKGKRKLASRVLCTWKHGRAPSKKHEAAHSCGKGHIGCINPNHLEWKTHKDNMRDRYVHKTMGHKLNEKLVRKIRKKCNTSKDSFRLIGEEFGVSAVTIYNIYHRITWNI